MSWFYHYDKAEKEIAAALHGRKGSLWGWVGYGDQGLELHDVSNVPIVESPVNYELDTIEGEVGREVPPPIINMGRGRR